MDIVERLRDYGDHLDYQIHEDMAEAADEIERLRKANQAAAECVAAMMQECARYRDEMPRPSGEQP